MSQDRSHPRALTYYALTSEQASFHIVARRHIAALRQFGWTVVETDLDFNRSTLRNHDSGTATAIVHPLFYFRKWTEPFEEIARALALRHRVVIGMEVADTTAVSGRFAAWANRPEVAGIALPSRFCMRAFRRSGVTTRLGYVPHGFDPVAPSAKFDFLRQDLRPKVLCFAVGNPHRKGSDLLSAILSEFQDCLFVVKASPGFAVPSAAQNVMIVSEWLAEDDLASLYVNCDFLVSLHRGGAFEMNCAEAAGYGLPVIATGYGCVREYLTGPSAFLVGVKCVEQLFPTGNDHCGKGATADLGHAITQIAAVVANLADVRQLAASDAQRIRQEWSWQAATLRLVSFINACANSALTNNCAGGTAETTV